MYTIKQAAQLSAGDIKKLPENVRKAHEFAMKATKNGTSMAAYNGSNTIRKAVDAYLSELSKIMEKSSSSTSKKPDTGSKKSTNKKTKAESGTKNLHVRIQPKSANSKMYVVWDVDTNQIFANEYFKTVQEAKKFVNANKMILKEVRFTNQDSVKTKGKATASDVKYVEDIDIEIQFINRYKNLHGKIKTINQLTALLRSLQKAITKKQITSKSRFASEINTMQDELIKLVNKMEKEGLEQVEVNIVGIEKYKSIAASEKRLLSVTYLLRFIALTKKPDVVEKSERLSTQINNAIEKGKIKKSDKYFDELQTVNKKLKSYIKGSGTLEITEAQLNGLSRKVKREIAALEGLSGLNGAGAYAAGFFSSMASRYIYDKYVKPKTTSSSSDTSGGTKSTADTKISKNAKIMSSEDLAKMRFKTIKLAPEFSEMIGEPSQGSAIMIYGGPGSGKSTFEVLFAKSLATYNQKKVLIITDEEGFSKTMQEKMERLKAFHPNIFIAEEVPADINTFDVVFFDSVQSLRLNPEQLENFQKSNPNAMLVFVFQVTKEGKFKGEKEFEHIVQVVLHAENGIVSSEGEKNRFGGRGEIQVY